MLKCTLLVGVLALVAACESLPECRVGEVRFQGRPPRTMFAFDRTCRADCFSLPATEAGEARCDPDCPDVLVDNPDGALFDDRILELVDVESLNEDGSTQTLALIYTFGFVDDAGGNAPDAWGMTAVGPRTYLSDQVDGTAHFVMDVGVSEVERLADQDLLMIRETVSAASAETGRLEILTATPSRIAGRFYLSYVTPTRQPQGEVVGCFDVELSEVQDDGGGSYQVIRP